MKNLGILGLLLLLAFSSCRKDIDIIEHTPDPTVIEGYVPNVQNINGSLIGFVVDANQEPVADAAVKMGNLTTTTDAYGHFFFTDIAMNKLGAFVQIEKAGYFEGSRRFFPIADSKNRVKIELLEKNFNLSFDTESGGVVVLPEGASVKFLANSIKNEDGTLYNGVVRVAAKWMNPTDLRTFDQMPGSLQGVGLSIDNKEEALATYGMMAVSLEGEAGEKLNIVDDYTATLTMPVPTALQANAPTEIILWSFNEEFGVWHEQSKAYLQDGAYVGEVKHFSFWNSGESMDYAQLTITLLDENGVGVSNIQIKLSATDAGCASGYTDGNGMASGNVPSGVDLYAAVYDLCGNVLVTANLGSFAEGTTTSTVVSPVSTANNTTIAGTLVCDGTPIADGVVKISFDGVSAYYYIDNANFSITTTACLSTTVIEVISINLVDAEQSEVVLATPGVQNDLGEIDVCAEELEAFISITVDGVTEVYLTPTMSSSATSDYTGFWANNNMTGGYISIDFQGLTVGNYDNNATVSVGIHESILNWSFVPGGIFTSFTVTEYGAIGEPIRGTYEGILPNVAYDPPVDATVSGSFKVIRTQ